MHIRTTCQHAADLLRERAGTKVGRGRRCLGTGCNGERHIEPTPPPLGSSTAATNATTAPLLPAGRFPFPTMTPVQFQQLLSQLKGTPVGRELLGVVVRPVPA